MSLTSTETHALYERYLIGNYGRMPLNIVRGEGSQLWDAEGKRYLDLIMGIGVNGLGHRPRRVVESLKRQLDQIMHVHNAYQWDLQAQLAEKLVRKTTGIEQPRLFFCNSGTEATEAAIKIARLYGKQHGGKWKIVSCLNGFHGRTYGALTATGQESLQKGCDPLLPGFTYVPLNDIAALRLAFDAETVAFMVEPVQGEGGIFLAEKSYLEEARKLCDRHGALLLYDEVQAGMGRTGNYFAYQTLAAPAPDVLWLAKALGGGFPIGATIASNKAAQYLIPGTHGCTFGGNHLACTAALAVIEAIDEDHLLEHAIAMGAHLREGLDRIKDKYPDKVNEVRSLGLMAALELKFPGADVLARCVKQGLLINCTHQTALRFLPAMTISKTEIDEALSIVESALV